MIVINTDEFTKYRNQLLEDLPKSVFVYPHDTIYGLGCNATDEELVSKVRRIKNSEQPFSVIAPSKEWIYQNCIITEEAEEWIRKLPGPYTLILKLKNKNAVARNVSHSSTIGIRIPNHWFYTVVKSLDFPIVSTSANVHGMDFMTDLEDLDVNIRSRVDYVFYEGAKRGCPSTIIDLSGVKITIKPRAASSKKEKERKGIFRKIAKPVRYVLGRK
jgi:L-threonylcarbamoyladenylate synthase